jgi:hypothetical protein
MIKHYKATVTLALFLIASLPVAANGATAPAPKVVFFGDQFTLNWTLPYANWVNKGAPGIYAPASMDVAVSRFQSDVVSQHPAIVHIMFGETDSEDMSPTTLEFYGPGLLADAEQMVAEAKAANIKVIFGLEPDALPQYKMLITEYGAFTGIPVINYSDQLGLLGGNYLIPDPATSEFGGFPICNPAGYALMDQMAQAVISTIGLNPQGGYLQNTSYWQGASVNINQTGLFHEVQFTPTGYYSNGAVVPMINTNYLTQSNGTWTSSNPLVAFVNQTGHVWALTIGKTSISYISPTGVHFSPWTLTVNGYGGQGGPSTL